MKSSNKVHLVLGSGGARGLAHIGVIEALEENGFEIVSVAGSSMGALIGGIYCAGHLKTYKDWIVNLDKFDVLKLLDFTFSTNGFVKGDRVFKAIEKLIGEHYIEDFKIPFTAVATNVTSKNEVHFQEGRLFAALRASVAIPTVLTPVSNHTGQLVDGGVLNPLPLSLVKKKLGELVVAVNVNANIPIPKKSVKQKEIEKSEKNDYLSKMYGLLNSYMPQSKAKETQEKLGLFDLLNRSIDLLQDRLTEVTLQQYRPDILVDISRETCSTFEFYRAQELIELGRSNFGKELERFNLKAKEIQDKPTQASKV